MQSGRPPYLRAADWAGRKSMRSGHSIRFETIPRLLRGPGTTTTGHSEAERGGRHPHTRRTCSNRTSTTVTVALVDRTTKRALLRLRVPITNTNNRATGLVPATTTSEYLILLLVEPLYYNDYVKVLRVPLPLLLLTAANTLLHTTTYYYTTAATN